jgi:hypothetical protein
MTGIDKTLEQVEDDERAKKLRNSPHILHPAGGLTENFVYEPITEEKNVFYVYKTKDGHRGLTPLIIEFENEDKHKHPHFSIKVEGQQSYFSDKIPREFLFSMPDQTMVVKWVKGEKQGLNMEQLQRLNSVYLRTFLDFPHEFEFSVVRLFIQQSWLSELLPVVFYVGVKGEYGGGKTVTGEAIVLICRHGYLTGNLSPPFVARSIQNQKLTLMVDELDSIAGTKDSDLNSIFRQGYRRGMKYSRTNPDTLEPESYLIFGPKLFTVHTDIEEALQTRTVPIHVRETGKPEYPIVNLDKSAFSKKVYTENFLSYLDNILSFRDNDIHLISGLADLSVDVVDLVDPKTGDINVGSQAAKIRQILYEKKKTLLSEGQLSQLCQLSGRNIELMFTCFVLANLTKSNCNNDLVETFNQKLVEEGERTEIGYVGALKEVLTGLWKEKQSLPEYKNEAGLVKVSNKEIYDKYNSKLKKEYGEGVSPPKFKEYLTEFGFTDGLNRTKQKVPLPSDADPKPRLCNIFNDRVLRKLGIEEKESGENGNGEAKPKFILNVYRVRNGEPCGCSLYAVEFELHDTLENKRLRKCDGCVKAEMKGFADRGYQIVYPAENSEEGAS